MTPPLLKVVGTPADAAEPVLLVPASFGYVARPAAACVPGSYPTDGSVAARADLPFFGWLWGWRTIELPEFASVELPDLTFAGSITAVAGSGTFSAPLLRDVGVLTVNLAASVSAPLLASAYEVGFDGLAAAGVALPSLAHVTRIFQISNSATVAAVSLPALADVGAIFITGNAALTSVAFPSLLAVRGNVSLGANALDQASVDAVLVKLAALDGTGGTTEFSGRSVDVSAGTSSAPSAAGLAAKATLEARGCTVTVNP
jgi:hypothetical protein